MQELTIYHLSGTDGTIPTLCEVVWGNVVGRRVFSFLTVMYLIYSNIWRCKQFKLFIKEFFCVVRAKLFTFRTFLDWPHINTCFKAVERLG